MRELLNRKSRRAVSGIVGILLILIVLFALVVSLWYYIPKIEPEKIPEIVFSSVYYPEGGLLNLIVTSVTDPKWEDVKIMVYVNGTPMKNLNFTLYPGGISPPSGEIKAGQVLVAKVPWRPSKIVAIYDKTNSVIYSSTKVVVGSPMIITHKAKIAYHFDLIGSVKTIFTYNQHLNNEIGYFFILVEFENVKQLIPENDIKATLKVTNPPPSSYHLRNLILPSNLKIVSGHYYFGNGSGIFVLGYYSLPSTYAYLNLTYVPKDYQFFSGEYYFKK